MTDSPASRNRPGFFLEDETLPVTIDNYRSLLASGRITEDNLWGIKQNAAKVQDEDELYIYTGFQHLGIIGSATIESVHSISDLNPDIVQSRDFSECQSVLRISYDLLKCSYLLDRPIPQRQILEWVGAPRRNVADLSSCAARLGSLLPWGRQGDDETSDSCLDEPQAIEGLKSEITRIAVQRCAWLRDLAIEEARGVCCVCDRDFSQVLGGRGVRVLHVHHRAQLSSRTVPTITRMSDLAVVCANCHMLLHLDPSQAMKVEELRELLQADGLYDSDSRAYFGTRFRV